MVEKLVGEGGFGMVYKGVYQGFIPVAIKELRAKSTGDEDSEDSLNEFKEFQREVSIMSELNHKNLVQLYGISIAPQLRMIMEWCPGGDLYHFLAHAQPVCWALKYRIAYDIACGMKYLQDVTPPIIHRDLRSPNVFIMSTNPKDPVVAKIADFGLSLRVEHLVGGISSSSPSPNAPEPP